MRTFLVTGGAGFIGGWFVRQTLAAGTARVVNLDKLTYAGNLDSLADVAERSDYLFVQGDICDRTLVRELLRSHRPAAIVNFAAESHVDRSIDGPSAFVETNVVGTCTLLEETLHYWRGLEPADAERLRLLHISTDEVYGSLGATGMFTEQSPYAPNSPYSASKAGADHLVRAFFQTYGLPVLTTNCSNNYGPYQFPEKLIPLMITRARAGESLPIYGDGQQVRDWLYVEDHCRALQRVLEAGRVGEVYNIGGNCQRTNLQVVEAICQLVDEMLPELPRASCRELITPVPDRPGHDRRYAIDTGKIARELGWQPQETFESGLRRTVRWYLDHADWLARIAANTYQGERLGLPEEHEP